jgi:hypothetical protein
VDYFEKVTFEWSILRPDMGYQYVTSVFACALLCQQRKLSTFVALPDEVLMVCQLNKKKGRCMEKEEAMANTGSRMYQQKVINSL